MEPDILVSVYKGELGLERAGNGFRRTGEEPRVVLWGTGAPRREFLHVGDLADACLFLMRHYSGEVIVNVGVGEDVTIRELAEMVREIVGFEGEVVWDDSKPDRTPRKLMDVLRLHEMGWTASIPLRDGVATAYGNLQNEPLEETA